MECSGNRKFVTSEAKAKSILRTDGIIDEFLIIKRLNDFRIKVTEWTNYAREKYNIKERLFSEEQFGNRIKAVPNKKVFKVIDNAKGIFYQEEELMSSMVLEPTLNRVKEAIKRMGIDIQTLSDYLKGNPNVDIKGINGLADLVKGVIAISHGMENVTLTEEFVHIATAILEQTHPKLITELISKIDRFQIYNLTLNAYTSNPSYQLPNGKPNIRKIKKEAVDKLITEVIINNSENTTEFPELLKEENKSLIEKWWETIKDYIRGIYRKTNIDIFNLVGEKILNEDIGTKENIENKETFYQIRNDAIDKAYNIYKDYDSRIELFPDSPLDKRHYIFDGTKRVATTVTEKTKASNKMPERTSFQKIKDEEMREWGFEGHSFQEQDLLVNFIDKDGFPKEATDIDIGSKLNPEIKKRLHEFNRELINSYPKGTRFLVELKVINTKEKGLLASTVDFKAIYPNMDVKTKDKLPFFVDTLDWKFMGIDKTQEEDVPWYKKTDWKAQMGEYVKMDKEYGINPLQIKKARMIPFQLNYDYKIPGDKRSGLYATSIEIGKLNNLAETNMYLLHVPAEIESSGSVEVDALIKALDADYEKLVRQHFEPEEKIIKTTRLKQLSRAIRLLRMKLDFAPLSEIGKKFLLDAKEAFKTFKDIDYTKLEEGEIRKKTEELLEFKKRAEKFAKLDETYLSIHPKEGLDKEGEEILKSFERIASSTDRMMKEIVELLRQYTIQLALITGVTTEETKESILTPEKEMNGIFKYLSEPSTMSSSIVNLLTNLALNNRSKVNIKMGELLTEFGKFLLPLENLARNKGTSAFDLIGKVKNGELHLIEKIDPKFNDDLAKARSEKNKKFFLDNLNLETYNKLKETTLEKGIKEIEATIFSSNEEDNLNRREYEKTKLKNSLNIESQSFNGYNDHYHFIPLFKKAMRADLHHSAEYTNMVKDKEAFEMWNFLIDLNNRAIKAGYINNGSISFFALIEASMLNKLAATDNLLSEAGDLFQDLYTVRINEENQYATIDPETNQPRKIIPKLFTQTDKQLHQLSRDLTRVVPLWIKSLLEYEAARNMEMNVLALIEVEKSKGHIVVDKENNIVWEGLSPKVDLSSNSTVGILETMADDLVYGIHEDTSSIGSVSMETIAEKFSKDKEGTEQKVVSAKKALENMNALTQSLAVGLRWLIAVPNYFGNHFQQFINNGGMYKPLEFEKNHAKLILGTLSTVQKGLIDLFVPLNGDPYIEARRRIAWKQGYIKWLGTWTVQEAMMSTNYLPERNLQFTNAISLIDNAMVVDGKIVNIRKFLTKQDQMKYAKDEEGNFIISEEERHSLEKTFDQRVKELKESSSLSKIAKIEDDKIVIPGISIDEMAKFRTTIVEWGRNLNGQMSQENKAKYRRDVLLKSFAMFRNWIVRQVTVRGHDIKQNLEIGQWEYGRVRAFAKTLIQACNWNIFRMMDIINGTDRGLAILDEMLQQKKDDYYKKNGKELIITTEEFYDMMRQTLSNEMKELGLLLGLTALILSAKLLVPDDDEDIGTKNKYKYFLKVILKIKNEVDFYYNPISFMTMTKGSFLPALGTLSNAYRAMESLGVATYAYTVGDEELLEKTHATKQILNIIPGASQFNRDWLPMIAPDLSREIGNVVIPQARPGQQ